jgi:6-phosphogluconolactonase (cycloisomerase 2 family)
MRNLQAGPGFARGVGGAAALGAALVAARGAAAQAELPTVFIANNVSDEISTFTVGDAGAATFVANHPSSDGPATLALSPDGRHLAVPHATANEVSEVLMVYEVEPDSTLTPRLTTLVPNAPLATLWVRDDVLAVTLTSTTGPNFVRLYDWDARSGTLTFTQAVASGAFTTSLALVPDGDVLYSQDSFGNMVGWHLLDADGAVVGGGSVSTGAVFPLELAITNDGAHLYACGGISQGGHNVLGFSLASEGDPTALPGSPFQSPGNSPAHLAVSGDGALVFVGHGSDATVRSFHRAPDGTLTPTGHSFDVGLQGTIGDVAVMGDLLLVTDESTALDGISGLYVFNIVPDGAFAPAGPIVATGGVRPESMAAWHPSAMPGDATGDGAVDVEDMVLVILEWGASGGSPADVNGDGVVDVEDLVLVILHWT